MDDGQSEIFRIMKSTDEEIVKNFCKRFNAFATRNDFPNHYSYREVSNK